MPNPMVSVIVPTYNSHDNLKDFLESFFMSSYENFEIIVNDDLRSSDKSNELCNEYKQKGLDVKYFQENKSMAQGRKRGVDFSTGEILLHLDSDMKVTKDLLKECGELIVSGYDALVMPEESYGTTFWAKCKWLEKKCYENVEEIQSLRCIKKDVYVKVGGHDECMIFSEDKDLDIRVRDAGYKVGETKNFLYHNEGNLKLLKTLKKKLNYSNTANLFAEKHPKQFRWQANPVNRYIIFLKNIKYLFIHPLLYIGMIFMKTCEYVFATFGYFRKISNKK
jgi:arabinofuranan 3-O-arabinosyltransferase